MLVKMEAANVELSASRALSRHSSSGNKLPNDACGVAAQRMVLLWRMRFEPTDMGSTAEGLPNDKGFALIAEVEVHAQGLPIPGK